MGTTAEFDVVEVVERIVALRPHVASADELAWGDRAADRVRGWLDAWQAQVHGELSLPRPAPARPVGAVDEGDGTLDEFTGPIPEPAPSPLPSLGPSHGPIESERDRARRARRAILLADLPAFADALRAGRIATGHVDVLAAAVDRVPEPIRHRVIDGGDDLLAIARGCHPDRFSRSVQRAIAAAYEAEGVQRLAQQRARTGLRRGVDDVSGTYWLHVELDPARGDLLFQRLDAEREAIFHGGAHDGQSRSQVEAQALLNLLATSGPEQRSSTKKVHGLVLIDIETLALGAHERSVCETAGGRPLSPEVVRALICGAEVSFGFTIAGRVVHHVANAALATADQRRQLRMMHRTCVGPGCDQSFDHCQIHHVVPRSRDGPTAIPLMVPLCGDDHDAIHHRGWTLEIDEARNIRWIAPDGAISEVPFVGLADTDQPRLFPTDPAAA